ncbi:MAG: hypothetical protein ACFFFT_13550 [Candidatus Thorarchaeota archaeon]
MGLDKWIKNEQDVKSEKREKKQPVKVKKSKGEGEKKPDLEKSSMTLVKYILTCSNARCKYQKIIMKKQLTENDKICPRCNKEMKIKN